MKYVRTNDNIYEHDETHNYDNGVISKNIEKLFDEIMFVCKDGFVGFCYKPWAKDPEAYKDCEIYGAIWITDNKGEPILKSVAKLDNGEFKLL